MKKKPCLEFTKIFTPECTHNEGHIECHRALLAKSIIEASFKPILNSRVPIGGFDVGVGFGLESIISD